MPFRFNRRGAIRGFMLVVMLAGIVMLFGSAPDGVDAQEGGNQTYTVQTGDNLFRISLRFGLTIQELAAANGIANPNIIHVGQVLVIPAGGTTPPPTTTPPTSGGDDGGTTPPPASSGSYTVAAGDNLSRIARQFNTTVAAIASANGITNVNLIFVGQVLNIPGGTGISGGDTSGGDTSGGGTTPPPVTTPGTSGGFELGGHVNGFGRVNEMRTAGMSWAKKQIRWNRGGGPEAAAGFINEAHANGFKALVAVVGNPSQMGDFNNYVNEFAAFLGQVAALGPDAIEVWNEPNLAREWPAGQINGNNYTQMLAAGYNAIKAANPNVMVISAALAPTGFFGGCQAGGCDDNVFLQQMRNAGATQYLDCIGAHYNEGIIGPDQRSGDPRGSHYSRYFFGTLDLYYNTFGGSRRVCWTELGYLTAEGYGALPGNFAWAQNTSVGQHAEWLGRASTLSRSSGRVRMMIVWNVDFTGVWGDDPQGGYAIVRPDGSCPACSTLGASVQ